MKYTQFDCFKALNKISEDAGARNIIETLINDHFAMIDHMKKTSLYDVYMYEQRVTKGMSDPMRILAFENNEMKKEINSLRKKLGMCEKYKVVK